MTKNEIQKFCDKYTGKIIQDFPDYIICAQGEVYSVLGKRFLSKTYRKRNNQDINSKHDITVNLRLGNKTTVYPQAVHRLVAKAFINNPNNKQQVNHIDGNPENNDVSNLEWVTPQENVQHAVENRLYTGRYIPCTKSKLIYSLEKLNVFDSIASACRSNNLHERNSSANISETCKLNTNITEYQIPYSANNYVWKYVDIVNNTAEVKSNFIMYNQFDINKIKYAAINGNHRYYITIDGRVYDSYKNSWIKITKTLDNRINQYYATAKLHISDRKYKTIRIAKTVMEHFGIKEEDKRVWFKNNNTLDCRFENLIYKGPSNNDRQVVQYKIIYSEELVETYDSLTQAAESVGTTTTSVVSCANKNKEIPIGEKPYTSDGYVFRYI